MNKKIITVISVAGYSVARQAKQRSLHIILRFRAPVFHGFLPIFEPLNIIFVFEHALMISFSSLLNIYMF